MSRRHRLVPLAAGELKANVQQLQAEQRQAERQLDEVRKEIKSEKLEIAKTEAKTALVAKVGSLLGSGKLKAEREELQQRISALESQNEELVRHIKTMEQTAPNGTHTYMTINV